MAPVGCVLSLFRAIPTFRDIVPWKNMIEALLTLAMGICFYLLPAVYARQIERLRFALRWINWGGLLLVIWSLIQAYYWYSSGGYPDWVVVVQSWLTSNKLLLFPGRMTGMAYEPSWLAHQLNMLYLPLWLASTASGFSAHRHRLWIISLENVLLVGGMAVLALSISRVGLLAFLMMVAFWLLLLNLSLLRWVETRFLHLRQWTSRWAMFAARWAFRVLILVALLFVYLGIFLGAGYGLSRLDERMARLFDFKALMSRSFTDYANQLVFAERVVFWETGWNIFNDHPVLGVGIGNAGFYFQEELNSFSWSLDEVRKLLFEWTTLPNTKSLWMRLLAETGVLGFALFLSWIYGVWQSAALLRKRAEPLSRAMGLAGAFVVVGLGIEGFSLDSFALPYYWVSLGLVTAACEVARSTRNQPPSGDRGFTVGEKG